MPDLFVRNVWRIRAWQTFCTSRLVHVEIPNHFVRNVWRTHGYETTLHVACGGCARMLRQCKGIWALYTSVCAFEMNWNAKIQLFLVGYIRLHIEKKINIFLYENQCFF